MKLATWLMLFIFAGAGLVFGQSLDAIDSLALIDYEQFLRDEGLSETEVTQIAQLIEQTDTTRKESQLELNINKAQLEKALFNLDVNMQEVEKLLAGSHKSRLKAELAQIELYVKIRQLLGKERWAALIKALKEYPKQKGITRKQSDKPPVQKQKQPGSKN